MMFQSPNNWFFQRSSPMIGKQKKFSLLIVLENKARNNIELVDQK